GGLHPFHSPFQINSRRPGTFQIAGHPLYFNPEAFKGASLKIFNAQIKSISRRYADGRCTSDPQLFYGLPYPANIPDVTVYFAFGQIRLIQDPYMIVAPFYRLNDCFRIVTHKELVMIICLSDF